MMKIIIKGYNSFVDPFSDMGKIQCFIPVALLGIMQYLQEIW